jgi:multisubunit Na+/H+ antiporter MnhC subunit
MCFILLGLGLYCIVAKRNLIKIVIGFVIVEYAINLLFALIGYKEGGVAPILLKGLGEVVFVDPLPQALVLTAIVIGLGTTALLVSVCVRIYDRYGTFDIREIRRLRG